MSGRNDHVPPRMPFIHTPHDDGSPLCCGFFAATEGVPIILVFCLVGIAALCRG